MQIFTNRAKDRERITALEGKLKVLREDSDMLEERIAALSIRNAELVAFLKALPESIKKSKGGAEILAQRDALVEKAEQKS